MSVNIPEPVEEQYKVIRDVTYDDGKGNEAKERWESGCAPCKR